MKKLLLIAFLVISYAVSAQEEMLSFKDCLGKALENNLELKSAFNTRKIAQSQYKASYGKLLPNIYGSAENKNSWGRDVDPNSNLFINTDIKTYVGYINATYNLFAGFTVLNTIKMTKQDYNASKENVKRIENLVTIGVAEKFITILYLQEVIAANEAQIESSQKQIELAQLKFDSGVIAESEVFKIKSQKASEELQLITNQNYLMDNMVSLKQLMNMPLEKEITLIKPILTIDPKVETEQSPYEIISKAIAINPAYSMSLYKEKSARAALAVARAGRYPVLSFRAQYGTTYTNTKYEDHDEDLLDFKEQIRNNEINIFRLNLIIPVFSQLDNYAKIKKSKLEYKQSKLDTQMTQNLLSKEVLKAITDTKTSLKKNEASSKAFEFSQKSFDADALKFEMGKISIGELSLTKSNLNYSQAQLIKSKYELLYNNALIKFYLGEAFSL